MPDTSDTSGSVQFRPGTSGLSIQELVRRDLVDREALGRERYGTSLYAHNGRDGLRDAYEEALDLACYLRQLMEERGPHGQAQP